jgi:hypothetical protein
MLDEVQVLPRMNGTKKGIWAGAAGTEVEWDNVHVLNPRNDLAAILPAASMVDRALVITLAGSPTNAVPKQGWVQKVVPRYIPFGMPLLWSAAPAAVIVSAVADNILVSIGDVFDGAKGASATTVADGAVGVEGSITLTPVAAVVSHCVADFFVNIVHAEANTATTEADGSVVRLVKNIAAGPITGTTEADGATVTLTSVVHDGSGANGASARTQVGGMPGANIIPHTFLGGKYFLNDSDPSVINLLGKAAVCDGDFANAFLNPAEHVGGYHVYSADFNGDIFIAGVILHDKNSAYPDGISSLTQRDISFWSKDHTSNPDDNKYTKRITITAAQLYRKDQIMSIWFMEDKFIISRNFGVANFLMLIEGSPHGLRDPNENNIEFTEMQVIQYVTPS